MDPLCTITIPLPQIGRTCGGCTECCMAVAVGELEKPYFARCRFQNERGCSAYSERPRSCRQYHCAWLQGMMEERMRPDRSGFILSAEPGGLYVYIVRDQPLEPLLESLAAFDFATAEHGPVGTEATPIWVYRLGQRVATPFDNNPDNLGKPLPQRATLYSATNVRIGGKWFAVANGPCRDILRAGDAPCGMMKAKE